MYRLGRLEANFVCEDACCSSDRQVIHAIEGIIIEWTHQIRDILRTDSSAPLIAELNPNPFVEVKFWDEKAKNLANIYDQLREKKVRRMMEALREIDSSYYAAFKRIFRDTVAGGCVTIH